MFIYQHFKYLFIHKYLLSMIMDCKFTALCCKRLLWLHSYWRRKHTLIKFLFSPCNSGQGNASLATSQMFPHTCSIKAATAHKLIVPVIVASALTADVAHLIRPRPSQWPSAVQGAVWSAKVSWWSGPVFVIKTVPIYLLRITRVLVCGDRDSNALIHTNQRLKPRK